MRKTHKHAQLKAKIAKFHYPLDMSRRGEGKGLDALEFALSHVCGRNLVYASRSLDIV
jgi:hypothetical protein